jgi:hypothetical protein
VEDGVPNIITGVGPVNYRAQPGEVGYVPPEASEMAPETVPEPAPEPPPPPPASALKAEHVEYVAEALGVPPEEAESMTKPELVELAKQAAPRLTS